MPQCAEVLCKMPFCVQHECVCAQVLKYGIGTAAVLRLVMILLGSELIDSWKPVLLLFAGILLFSSYKLLASGDSDDADDEDLSDNGIVKLCRWACACTLAYCKGSTAAGCLLVSANEAHWALGRIIARLMSSSAVLLTCIKANPTFCCKQNCSKQHSLLQGCCAYARL